MSRDTTSPGHERHVAFSLEVLPEGTRLRSVSATPAEAGGVRALRLQLTDAVALEGVPDVDYVDMPTFALLPTVFGNGTVEVDILARLTPQAPDYARAFAGVAFHVADDGQEFECVYLRPLNGRTLDPPAPRDVRAVQYFSYPDWKYQRLRGDYPDGRYEAGADIGPGRWSRLRIDVEGSRVDVRVDGVPVLTDLAAKPRRPSGRVGLWVDIGTEAYFANLVISAR